MKVLVATPLYPPESGGPATYAKLLVEGFPKRGIEVELVKFSAVRHLPKIIRHMVYFWRMYRALEHADMALALDPVSVGVPTRAAARFRKKPYVVKIVGDYAWEQGQQRFGITTNLDDFVRAKKVPAPVQALRKMQTRVANDAARVIVPSKYLKEIVQAWGVPESKIHVIYNAVALEEGGAAPDAVKHLPHPLVVTAGRLVPWKRVDGVIDAIAQMTDVSLAIVGDGPERDALSHRVEKELPGKAVCTGSLSHADTLATMREADVFVLNSSYEGLSHLLIEAQLLGLPTIACRVGGNDEIITHKENGILIPPEDPQALTQELAQLLGDASLKNTLKRNAQEGGKRFSVDTMLDATAEFLKSP